MGFKIQRPPKQFNSRLTRFRAKPWIKARAATAASRQSQGCEHATTSKHWSRRCVSVTESQAPGCFRVNQPKIHLGVGHQHNCCPSQQFSPRSAALFHGCVVANEDHPPRWMVSSGLVQAQSGECNVCGETDDTGPILSRLCDQW